MQWSCLWCCLEQPPFVAVVGYTFGRKLMDKSVGQARWLLAVMCWFAFLVGHVLNNARGFG